LLDKKNLDFAYQNWIKNEKLALELSDEEFEEDLNQNPNSIKINKTTFIKNSERTKNFLEKNFPNVLPLYKDFINYINPKLENNTLIEIDFTEFSFFFNSIQYFHDSLSNELEAIENDNPALIEYLYSSDLIASGTGFESLPNSDFSKLPNYFNQLKTRSIPDFKKEKRYTFFDIALRIVIFALCPVFSLIAYKMWQKSGLDTSIAIIIITNIGFYVFSIWEISAIIKHYMNKK